MKQIFDWLREQIREIEITIDFRIKELLKKDNAADFEKLSTKQMTLLEVMSLINEAEAKWGGHAICYLDSPCEYQNEELRVDEADCCEWVIGNFCAKVECLGKVQEVGNPHNYIFCPYCGKPIKISEVE